MSVSRRSVRCCVLATLVTPLACVHSGDRPPSATATAEQPGPAGLPVVQARNPRPAPAPSVPPGTRRATSGKKPNVVFIMGDDVGWANIGGRYSALSDFGLVPAAIMGIDVRKLLERTEAMVHACAPSVAATKDW